MGGRLGRGRLRWLAIVCALVAVGGLVSSAKSALSEPTKQVTYKGYRIEVPDSWQVVDLARDPDACVRFDVHAVYLGHPGTQSSCPARLLGRTEALLVEPIDRTSKARASGAAVWTPKGKAAAAVPARTSHEVTIGVSGAGVLVTASYGDDLAKLDSVLGGATLTSDAQPATELAATTTAASSVVVPATYNGSGFDVCTAPSSSTMQAWLSSPYRAVGVYIGGISRACAQPNLTAAWVDQQVSSGWSLMPIYVGLQAPCTGFTNRIDPAKAPSQGRAAAEDAVVSAGSLGMTAGSVLCYDMEGYSTTDSACSNTVLSFLSNWSTRLHELGYKSGVYSSVSSGIRDLVSVYNSTTFVRPDHIWFARWDEVATVSDTAIPSTYWANHQRIKQYQGDHDKTGAPHIETWGGVSIQIDSDYLDVATSAPPPPPVDDGDQDSPAVVTVGSELHAFARGTDQRVYERYLRSGSAWSKWTARGSLAVAGDPVALTDGTNISVFARGTDQRLYDTTFRPTTRWSAWTAHPGVTVAGNPGVVNLGSEFHVFVRGTDSAVYETFYRPSFGWSSWTPHAGRTLAGDPTAVRYGTGGINLYVRSNNHRLYETYFRPTTGWSAWHVKGGTAVGIA